MLLLKKILLSLAIISLPSLIFANPEKKSLSTILDDLSHSRSINISYSPDFTNGIFPKHTFDESASTDKILTSLLRGTHLSFKQVSDDNYIIFEEKKVERHFRRIPKMTCSKAKEPAIYTSFAPCVEGDIVIPAKKESPVLSLKLNLLYLLSTTINCGVEVGVANNMSVNISSTINAWGLNSSTKIHAFAIEPEFRYWTNSRLKGSFFGANIFASYYDVAGISLFLNNEPYQGILYGGGLSYGYNCFFTEKLGMEATIGLGYAHIHYNSVGTYNYFGPTKIGLSLVYIIK